MTKIYPEGGESMPDSTPLEIDESKRDEMIIKAKELLTEPMNLDALLSKLENYYVFKLNEHYTSDQLKDVVLQVQSDLAPKEEVTK